MEACQFIHIYISNIQIDTQGYVMEAYNSNYKIDTHEIL